MAWVAPVIDRQQSDIDDKTTKGFFNVADWTRINGNTTVVKDMLSTNGYAVGSLHTLTPPTVTTIPTVGSINDMIENIQLVADWCLLPVAIGLVELKYDYQAGPNEEVPNFEDVNAWENNLLLIYTAIPKAVSYRIQCGVSNCGQVRLWQNRFRRYYTPI